MARGRSPISASVFPSLPGGRVKPSGPQSAKGGTNNVQGKGGGTSGSGLPASARMDQRIATKSGKFPSHNGRAK